MSSISFARYVVGAMTMAGLLGALACRPSGPDQAVQHMAQRNAELDQLGQQTGNPGLTPVGDLKATGGHANSFQAYSAWLRSADPD
jgi:hypothetical protein